MACEHSKRMFGRWCPAWSHSGDGGWVPRKSRDHDDVRTRFTRGNVLPAATSLIAVAVMGVASFLPYVQYPWTDGIFSFPSTSAPITVSEISSTLAQGTDASLALVTLIVLGVVTAMYLLGIARRITGIASIGAALLAVTIAVTYPGTLVIGPPVPAYGFYVFVTAAAVAVIAGLVMVWTSFRGAGGVAKGQPGSIPSALARRA
jgi:hypothetical protein